MNMMAVHNVVQLGDDEVRDRFVVRGHELDELLVHLRESGPPRHALVIGQRGMGKSLLLRRVAVTVADDPDLAARWLPVLMPEELYEVTSVGELWLAALDRLATATGDAGLRDQVAALRAERDPSRMAALALERLLAAGRSSGRRILLLAENVDMLLDDQVADDEGWALRHALQTEADLLLMASAVTTFAQVEDSGAAFYGFFHRLDLQPLDDADVHALWHKVTGVDLAGDRAVPIRILTGGNPRLITVLGRFSTRPDLQNLRRDLELLIDEYTPYFKANIEVLPPVERKVFVTLADIWAPATAAEVAERARMTTSKVSSLLGRLVHRGAVQVVGEDAGKHRYELAERLYNLYHLLRRPDGEGRVRALVDILIHLYDPVDLERDVFPGLAALPPSALDTAVATRIHRYLQDAAVWDRMPDDQFAGRLAIFEALLAAQRATRGDSDPEALLTRAQIAFATGALGDHEGALAQYREVLAEQEEVLGPDHRDTLASRLGVAYYTGETGDHPGALGLYRAVSADAERVLGADDRSTLLARHGVAYYLWLAGARSAAEDIEGEVLRRAEAALGSADDFVDVAWWLYAALAAASPKPLPRELEEAVRRHPSLRS